MNKDELEKFNSGKYSFPMPYQDYLNIIGDTEEKLKISELFLSFFESMEFAAKIYGYQHPLPPLYADPLRKIVARVTSEKITISQGMISHIFDICEKVRIYDMKDFKISLEILIRLTGFWIISHELFHIARGHLSLFNDYHSDYSIAFEYDADCLASAALYRYIQREIFPSSSRISNKKVATFIIFICTRTLLGKTESNVFGNKTHPSFVERLTYCIGKVTALDEPYPNIGFNEEFANECKNVLKFITKIEAEFIEIKENKIEKCAVSFEGMNFDVESIFFRHVFKIATCDLKELHVQNKWEEIAPIVEKASMLTIFQNRHTKLKYNIDFK